MLELLGLSAEVDAVYSVMVSRRDLGVEAIAEQLGVSVDAVRSALNVLIERNLLRYDAPNGALRVVNPNVSLAGLLAAAEAEVSARSQQIHAMRATLAAIAAEHNSVHDRDEATRLVGLEVVRERLAELAANATTECMSLNPNSAQTPSAKRASKSLNEQLLERGVAIRCIYQESFRNEPNLLAYARWLTSLGGLTRTVPVVPLMMVVIDYATVLLPLDPRDSAAGAVEIASPGVVAASCALFEQLWANATPLGELAIHDDNGLDPMQSEMLHLLAIGHTDEAVARNLGISVSTVRRTMAMLTTRLGARSRFQAGVLAAARGWIHPGQC